MATYGYTGVGATGWKTIERRRGGISITVPGGEEIVRIRAYLRSQGSATGGISAGLYLDSDDSVAYTSDVLAGFTDTTGQWRDLVFTIPTTPTAQTYWLTVIGDAVAGGANTVEIAYDTVAASAATYEFWFWNSAVWPLQDADLTGLETGEGNTHRISLYLETSSGAAAPSITDVDEDNTLTLSQANVEIDGADFDTATVEIRQGAFTYPCTIDSQNATTIVFDMPSNALVVAPKHGAATLAVINGDAQEDTHAITITADAGSDYVDAGTPNADPDIRLTGTGDVVSGDQVEWGNVQGTAVDETDVTVNADLTWEAAEAVTSFDFRIWDQSDSSWGAWATQSISEPAPVVATPETSSAGFSNWYDILENQRRRRAKKKREDEEAEEALADNVEHEIAQLLHKQIEKDERRKELQRIKELVKQYAKATDTPSLRVQKAIQEATIKQTLDSYEKVQKEFLRMMEEEEFAVILAMAT